jgi:hypothetical protein
MRFEIPGDNKLKIFDDAEEENVVDYTVVVTPRFGPKRLILCDPRVSNKLEDPPIKTTEPCSEQTNGLSSEAKRYGDSFKI